MPTPTRAPSQTLSRGLSILEILADASGPLGIDDVAAHLGGPAGESLLHSARAAFDSGVGITSGIGVVLMLGAVLMALRTLRDAKS